MRSAHHLGNRFARIDLEGVVGLPQTDDRSFVKSSWAATNARRWSNKTIEQSLPVTQGNLGWKVACDAKRFCI